MAKTISKDVKEEIRAMYVMNKYTSIKELAERYGVAETWIYNTKAKEQWDLLKQELKEDNIIDAVKQQLKDVLDSIAFYEKVKKLCSDRLDDAMKHRIIKKFYKGEVIDVVATLDTVELKQLVESYQSAEERCLLLKSIQLRGEEKNVEE